MSVSQSKIYEYASKLACGVCPVCGGEATQTKRDPWFPQYECEKCNRVFKLFYDDVGVTESGEDVVELIDIEVENK